MWACWRRKPAVTPSIVPSRPPTVMVPTRTPETRPAFDTYRWPKPMARLRHVARPMPTAVHLATVQTNMVYLTVDDAAALVADLARHGVKANALGARSVRLVTHHQIDDEDVAAALAVIEERLARRAA